MISSEVEKRMLVSHILCHHASMLISLSLFLAAQKTALQQCQVFFSIFSFCNIVAVVVVPFLFDSNLCIYLTIVGLCVIEREKVEKLFFPQNHSFYSFLSPFNWYEWKNQTFFCRWELSSFFLLLRRKSTNRFMIVYRILNLPFIKSL